LRLDREISLLLSAPVARALENRRRPAIPILMYHSIACDTDCTASAYFRTVTSPATFRRHIDYLAEAGYCGVTLSEALSGCPDHFDAHRRPVVITFDDGFRDFATNAFPMLDRVNFKATVFIATAYVGGKFPTGRPCLERRDIGELAANGVDFGSHSVTHRQLDMLPSREVDAELVHSKSELEDMTGRAVSLFSLPYRFPAENRSFVRYLGDAMNRTGYTAGVTTMIRRWTPDDDHRFLPRLPINDCDDLSLFGAKLQGGYDWMHNAQLVRKWARRASPTSKRR
jgi:peptidoglycan/xylan/chitin deacetylase (PgdA/CDA1 family)